MAAANYPTRRTTSAAIASRDPKRLRKIIAGMSTHTRPEVDTETELLQNTPVAAK